MKKTNTSLVLLKYSLCLYNFIFLVWYEKVIIIHTKGLFQLSGCIVCGLGLWAVLESWELVSITPGYMYQVKKRF